MSKHRRHDFDDGFDEDSLFDDEEFVHDRAGMRRDRKPLSKAPKGSQDRDPPHHDDRTSRRRDYAMAKAWGAPY